jgi:hypothetical protein
MVVWRFLLMHLCLQQKEEEKEVAGEPDQGLCQPEQV